MRFTTYKDVLSQLVFHSFILVIIALGLFWFNSLDIKTYLFASLLVSILSFGNLKLFYLGEGRSEFYRSNQYSFTNINRRIFFEMIMFITPFIIIESFVFKDVFMYYLIVKYSLSVLIANCVLYTKKANVLLTIVLMFLVLSEMSLLDLSIIMSICSVVSLIINIKITSSSK